MKSTTDKEQTNVGYQPDLAQICIAVCFVYKNYMFYKLEQ